MCRASSGVKTTSHLTLYWLDAHHFELSTNCCATPNRLKWLKTNPSRLTEPFEHYKPLTLLFSNKVRAVFRRFLAVFWHRIIVFIIWTSSSNPIKLKIWGNFPRASMSIPSNFQLSSCSGSYFCESDKKFKFNMHFWKSSCWLTRVPPHRSSSKFEGLFLKCQRTFPQIFSLLAIREVGFVNLIKSSSSTCIFEKVLNDLTTMLHTDQAQNLRVCSSSVKEHSLKFSAF